MPVPEQPGKIPDLPAHPGRRSLFRRLMLRASAVALLTLALVAAAGVWATQGDIDRELQSVLRLTRTLERLTRADDGPAAVAALSISEAPPQALRHLSLGLRDGDGRVQLQWSVESESAPWIDALARWQVRWGGEPDLPPVVWSVPQHEGEPWTLTLMPDPLSERREALADLARVLLTMGLGTVLLLVVLGWSLARSLRPLQRVAGALADIRPGHTAAARQLQDVRLLEIDRVTHAVHRLAQALDRTEDERRLLAQKLQSMQEAERLRLGRELHDEWGQRLTSLRLDAAWLARRLAGQPELAQASQRMGEQCASLHEDLRQRLRLLAPRDLGDGDTEGLREALQDLVAGWSSPAGSAHLAVDLRWEDGRTPGLPAASGPRIGADLLLAVYRSSQEGLTNVARHAAATRAELAVRITPDRLHWQLSDDGIGLSDVGAAVQRGSGLASLRERAWSHGSELHMDATRPGTDRPGLTLSASFALQDPPSRAGAAQN